MDEAFGVCAVSGIEDDAPMLDDLVGETVVDNMRGEKADSRVAVFEVVPRKEGPAVIPSDFDGVELAREIRAIFERFELAFGERVVVGGIGSAVGLGDAEVGEEKGNGLRSHR